MQDNTKDVMVSVHPKLYGIAARYELSGAYAGWQSEESDIHEHFGLSQCIDKDDWHNFIESNTGSYLLYL